MVSIILFDKDVLAPGIFTSFPPLLYSKNRSQQEIFYGENDGSGSG
jgi:hypothetical protein